MVNSTILIGVIVLLAIVIGVLIRAYNRKNNEIYDLKQEVDYNVGTYKAQVRKMNTLEESNKTLKKINEEASKHRELLAQCISLDSKGVNSNSVQIRNIIFLDTKGNKVNNKNVILRVGKSGNPSNIHINSYIENKRKAEKVFMYFDLNM